MSDETAAELAACLAYARVVREALPEDEEAQRCVDAVLARQQTKAPIKRILKRRGSPS